ncbi:hypothetical protein [Edwardsiella anguillarum]|uniref:hypothetical protein n=1 Tax=Edwardsiella anguillarum TaxID=1821960 RepID=UPI0024B869FC|nr:hypothetical protein [Edwardsiella anguillarum]WHQ12984.1 hypothetical protein MQ083_11830 [Edwardsiella anguillarum]
MLEVENKTNISGEEITLALKTLAESSATLSKKNTQGIIPQSNTRSIYIEKSVLFSLDSTIIKQKIFFDDAK